MKKSLLLIITIFVTNSAFAWTQLARCTTPGDALEEVMLYTDGADLILHISSAAEHPPVEEFRTTNGDLEHKLKINYEMNMIHKGHLRSYILAKKDSFAFGGMMRDTALLNIKVHTDGYSTDLNSHIAAHGNVYYLHCNQPE